MTPLQFVDKWRPVTLTERASAQEHFIDLCRLFDHPTPVEADRTGQDFTFEKGVTKAGGGQGFADVWKRGFFAWEYKKRHRDLEAALGQLSRYALALENPPLQVACDAGVDDPHRDHALCHETGDARGVRRRAEGSAGRRDVARR